MLTVELYLDYACPWSYLGFHRLCETATRTGATMVLKPVVLDSVLEQTNPALARDRREPQLAKARYQAKDLNDWADFCGLRLRRPPGWPASSQLAARGAIMACEQGHGERYSREVFAAYFGAEENLASPDMLTRAAKRAGLAADVVESALSDADVSARLRANCDELLDRGGFGTPTMFVAAAMFFGSDRMPLVEFALGRASGRTFVAPGDHRA